MKKENLINCLWLTIEKRKSIIDYFINNIKDKDILEKTIDNLKLDINTIYWKSRIEFLKDFQAYVLKNWIDNNIKSILISLPYNM